MNDKQQWLSICTHYNVPYFGRNVFLFSQEGMVRLVKYFTKIPTDKYSANLRNGVILFVDKKTEAGSWQPEPMGGRWQFKFKNRKNVFELRSSGFGLRSSDY